MTWRGLSSAVFVLTAVSTLFLFVNTTAVSVDPSLLGHWAFDDGTGANSTGNGNNGVVKGPVLAAGQVRVGALDFDGTDDHVDAGFIDVPGSAVTLAALINSDDLSNCIASDCRIASKASGTGTQDHYLMLSTINSRGLKLRFRVKAVGSTETLISTSGSIVNGQWIHVAGTYDGTTMRVYIDGVEAGSKSKGGAINANAAVPLWIGGNPLVATSRPWDGKIDEVRLYDKALILAEVQDLAGQTPPPDTVPPVRSNGSPTGLLPAGTAQTALALVTDEAATCKYGLAPDIEFASMTELFSAVGGTAHSARVSGLLDGGSYSYYVRCEDIAAPPTANTDDFVISFSIDVLGPDLTPPVRFNGSPTGSFLSGTTEATLSVATDEAATCKYGTVPGTDFAMLTEVFAGAGGTSHSAQVSGLSDGQSFDFYVRCLDEAPALNVNTDDFAISFSVSDPIGNGIGYWTFDDGTGADSSGNGNDGTVNGAVLIGGQVGAGALTFDGVDDHVSLGSLDIVDSAGEPTTGMAVSAWVNSNDLTNCSASDCRIVSKADGTGEQDHYWMLSTTKVGKKVRLRFRLKTEGLTHTLVASSPIWRMTSGFTSPLFTTVPL